ncbi:DUF6541 family protein [Chloroflexota bacterium]
MKTTRAIKITGAICLVLITVALLTSWNTPATGYEASIYTATPPMVWVVLFVSIICGAGIVVQQIYTREHERRNLWKIGLLLIVLSVTTVLSLQIIRGYAMWGRGDVPSHLGIVQDIISNGHIGRQNFYPAAHIYLTQFSSICDIAPIVISKYMPIFFALLYVLFIYLLAKSVLPHKSQRILVILAAMASVTFLHDYRNTLILVPNHLANFFLPLVFFLLIKKSATNTSGLRMQFSLLILVTILFLPLFHPVPAFALLVMVLTIWFPAKIFNKFKRGASTGITISSPRLDATISLLLIIWIITWISSFSVYESIISNLYILATEESQTHLDLLLINIQYAQLYGYNSVAQFIKVYGCQLIYLVLLLISIPVVLKRLNKEYSPLVSLYGPFGMFILLTGIFYISNVIGGPMRIFQYSIMLSTIFTGFTLYWIIEKAQHSYHLIYLPGLYSSLVLLLLILVFTGGILRFYPSSYTLVPNAQITQTEIEGMKWCFDNKNNDIGISSIFIDAKRFADFLVTPEERKHLRYTPIETSETRAPWHFGYDENATIGDSYVGDNYLALNEMDRVIYQEVFQGMAEFRFNPTNFEKLQQDTSVDKVYSNKGLDIWYINACTSNP